MLLLNHPKHATEGDVNLNANFLKAKMVENGYTQSRLALEAGMSENSLSRKINGKREFKLCEVCRICKILNIKDPSSIFLFDSSQIRDENEN